MKLLGENNNKISLLKDPFQKEKINGMSFFLHSFGNRMYWEGTIKFQNGNTGGSFKTKEYKADEFLLCVKEAEELIKNL